MVPAPTLNEWGLLVPATNFCINFYVLLEVLTSDSRVDLSKSADCDLQPSTVLAPNDSGL